MRRVLSTAEFVQHFQKSELWGGHHVLETTQRRDAIKDRFAAARSYRLIRIPYWEFGRIEEILRRELLTSAHQAAA